VIVTGAELFPWGTKTEKKAQSSAREGNMTSRVTNYTDLLGLRSFLGPVAFSAKISKVFGKPE
jgi:hypothetical protein